MTVSVIIRTYTEERWDYFVEAVNSLFVQTRRPDEVVLVVDHNPALLEKVRCMFPTANTVASETRGSSGAWNRGIHQANGDILAFMDDDAVAEPSWLEKLLAAYENDQVAGVGGTIEPNWLNGRPAWFPAEFQWVIGCTYRGMPEKVASVRNLIGCNMSFRRTALERIGGFKEIEGLGHMGKLPVGCDETEMCIRLRQQIPGSVLLHEPAAIVHHKVPASRSVFRYFRSRCFLEGQSKAVVSRLVGTQDGLSAESNYTFKVLPSGVLRGLADTLRGDLGGIQRSCAIVIGLGTTSISYLQARIRLAIERRGTPTRLAKAS
ncbi:MAG: glycosyltransferase family 2 protein [Chloroflexota bacterium]